VSHLISVQTGFSRPSYWHILKQGWNTVVIKHVLGLDYFWPIQTLLCIPLKHISVRLTSFIDTQNYMRILHNTSLLTESCLWIADMLSCCTPIFFSSIWIGIAFAYWLDNQGDGVQVLVGSWIFIILYFSILLHCIVQWVLQVKFPSVCSFIVLVFIK
jgi:hypothetical protein